MATGSQIFDLGPKSNTLPCPHISHEIHMEYVSPLNHVLTEMDSTWYLCSFHMESTWSLCGFHIDSMWNSCGMHLLFSSQIQKFNFIQTFDQLTT